MTAEARHENLLWTTSSASTHTVNLSTAISTMAERFPGEHMVVHADQCRVLLNACTCHPVIVMPSGRVA